MILDKEYSVDMGPFEDKVGVVFTRDIKKSLEQRLKRYKINESSDQGESSEALFYSCRGVEKTKVEMWLFYNVMSISPGMAGHETLHATCNILRHRSINLSEETEEVYTYVQQFLTDKVTVLFQKAKKHFEDNEKQS